MFAWNLNLCLKKNLQIMCLLTDHFEKCWQIILVLFLKYPARRQSQGTGSYSGPEIRVGNLWCSLFGSDNFLEIPAAGFVMTSNVLWLWISCYFWMLFLHSSHLLQGSLCFFPFPSPLSGQKALLLRATTLTASSPSLGSGI